VGPFGVATVEAFGAGGEHFDDKATLIAALQAQLHAGVTCLVKGSRSAGMEQVVAALGGHPGHADKNKGDASDAA
jgi:UDP-N-acetylmuramoyl-tripeptide--D-alanyl-D-alanine ligase